MSDKHLDDVSRVISARAWKLNVGFDGRWNFPLYGLIGCIVGNVVYRVFLRLKVGIYPPLLTILFKSVSCDSLSLQESDNKSLQ